MSVRAGVFYAAVLMCTQVVAEEKILLGDALAELDSQAQKTISDARLSGDLVVENAALKAANAIDLARANYSQALQETLDGLDPNISNFMGEMNAFLAQIETIDSKAKCISDEISLEIKSILSGVPFISSGSPAIQSVSGVDLAARNDLRLKISGTDIHPTSGNFRTEAAVRKGVSGEGVLPITYSVPKSGEMEIVVPEGFFAPYFKVDTVSFFPIEVDINRITKKWYGFIPFVDNFKSETQTISLNIVLLPDKAAKLKVTAVVPVYNWSNPRSETVTWTGPNFHCSDDCKGHYGGWSQNASRILPGGNVATPSEGDQRIVFLSGLRCEGGGCPYNADASTWVDSNDRRALGKYRARSHPTTNSFTFDYETWSLVGNDSFEVDVELLRGRISEVSLPKSARNILIQGVSAYNQPMSLSADLGSDRNPVISNVNQEVVGDEKIVSIAARDLLDFACK